METKMTLDYQIEKISHYRYQYLISGESCSLKAFIEALLGEGIERVYWFADPELPLFEKMFAPKDRLVVVMPNGCAEFLCIEGETSSEKYSRRLLELVEKLKDREPEAERKDSTSFTRQKCLYQQE
jgi:hypothetical protein